MVKVLYLAGWGRSGSTILDNILNSYDSIVSVGELYYLWRRGLLRGRRCGCGKRVRGCPFWREVLERAYGDQRPEPGEAAELQERVARVRNTRRLLAPTLSPAAEEYRDLMSRLYHAIADVSGAELIVDSSKLPSGAVLLARMPGVEAYLVQVVRDPRAVAHSWMRPPRRGLAQQHGPVESTAAWLTWNWLTERVARAYPGRARRVRYESFAADPRATVEDIIRFTGLDPVDGPFHDRQTVELVPAHAFSGNPGRFRTGPTTVRADEAWRQEQTAVPRLVSTALSLPLLHRYGYRIRTAAGATFNPERPA